MIERAIGIVLAGASAWWFMHSVRRRLIERHARRVAR